jgi:hypothetical protein
MTTDTASTSSEGVDVLSAFDDLIENGRRGRRALACDTRRRIRELIEAADMYVMSDPDHDCAHSAKMGRLLRAITACRATPGERT